MLPSASDGLDFSTEDLPDTRPMASPYSHFYKKNCGFLPTVAHGVAHTNVGKHAQIMHIIQIDPTGENVFVKCTIHMSR